MEVALISWLPLVNNPRASIRQEALDALSTLPELLDAAHKDPWLSDFIQVLRKKSSAGGALNLANALRFNATGDPQHALTSAEKATRLLKLEGNRPGWLRAELEEVYALQRRSQPAKCLAKASTLAGELSSLGYHWIMAQRALEESACNMMLGKFSTAQKASTEASSISRSFDYRALQLRGIGIQASLDNLTGNIATAWAEDQKGLEQYWKGSYPEQRVYQFYSDLGFLAQKEGYWFLASTAAHEAVLAIAKTPNRSVEAMAWSRLGALAQTAGMQDEAGVAFNQANVLFGMLPRGKVTALYALDCQINIAALEAAHGDLESSLQRLGHIREQVVRISNLALRQRFHQTLGSLYLQRGDDGEAEQELREAVKIGETGFRFIKTRKQRLAWEQENAGVYRSLVELLFVRRHKTVEALQLWLRFRSHGASLGSTSHAQPNQLDGNTVVRHDANPQQSATYLTYVQFPDGIALWSSDAQGTGARWISISERDLARLVQRFFEECSDPRAAATALGRDSHDLYRLLIGSVADRLAPKTVLVVRSDGLLTQVAMQALLDEDGEFLGLKHPIVYSQSFRNNGVPWRFVHIDSSEQALVVGEPVLAPEVISEFPPLPNASQEAELISSMFSDAKLLMRENATLKAVANNLKRAHVFHFAGHAAFDASGGGLLLTPAEYGSILNSSQLEQMPLQACKLVVLSACSTDNRDDSSANSGGVARAFLDAGVSEVVAARWNADSAATKSFMLAFYTALLHSKSGPMALNQAMLQLQRQPSTSHPYYWAVFNLYVAD